MTYVYKVAQYCSVNRKLSVETAEEKGERSREKGFPLSPPHPAEGLSPGEGLWRESNSQGAVPGGNLQGLYAPRPCKPRVSPGVHTPRPLQSLPRNLA